MTWSRFGIASLFVLALAGAGCYAPDLDDDSLRCTPPPSSRCPRGFGCYNGLCRRTERTPVNNEDGGTGGKPSDGSSNDGATDRPPDAMIGGGFGGSGLSGSGGNGGRIAGTGGTGSGGNGGRIAGTGGTGSGGMGSGGNGGQIAGTGGMGTGGMGVGGTPGAGVGGSGTGGRTGVGGAMVGTGGAGVGGSPVGTGGRGVGGTGVGGTGTGVRGVGGTGVGGTPGTGGSGAMDGTPCTSGTQCASTMCVDGFCCNLACNGQCQACDINPGICTVVTSGPPHGTRMACPAGTNPGCAAQCAGTPTQCGAFPTGKTCTCLVTVAGIDVGTCNSAGSCAVDLGPVLGLMLCDG